MIGMRTHKKRRGLLNRATSFISFTRLNIVNPKNDYDTPEQGIHLG